MRLTRHDTIWLLAVVSLLLSGASGGGSPAASSGAPPSGGPPPSAEAAGGPDEGARDRAPVAASEVRRPDTSPPAPRPSIPRVMTQPTVVRVPALGIDAPIVPLGTQADGTLEVPSDPGDVGWWADGVRPGGHGPAVLAGHVDWTDGPAVFFRLRELRTGDAIEVEGEDGHRLTFRVTEVVQVAKDGFPTAEVYGPTDAPTVRLITCGGAFDEQTRHYLDNVVVTAEWEPTADGGS